MPEEPFFNNHLHRISVFKLTYTLLYECSYEHCQGFDDIAAVIFEVCYNAFQIVSDLGKNKKIDNQ